MPAYHSTHAWAKLPCSSPPQHLRSKFKSPKSQLQVQTQIIHLANLGFRSCFFSTKCICSQGLVWIIFPESLFFLIQVDWTPEGRALHLWGWGSLEGNMIKGGPRNPRGSSINFHWIISVQIQWVLNFSRFRRIENRGESILSNCCHPFLSYRKIFHTMPLSYSISARSSFACLEDSFGVRTRWCGGDSARLGELP